MSQDLHQTISMENLKGNVSEASSVTPDKAGHPQLAQDQFPPQDYDRNFSDQVSDGADPLFSFYLRTASDEDGTMVERWRSDADGILIFSGVYSTAVAFLVSVSIRDLRPDPQVTSAFYLQNIYQLLADPNTRPNVSISALASPPPFSPPRYAVWVNSLWFLSLVLSYMCALLATLLRQWAYRYFTITHAPGGGHNPHKQGRIRAFVSEGVENLHLPWVVDALPSLLHLSFFLFFAGLLVFLFNIDSTVFSAVVWSVGLCAAVYLSITFMPLFRYDSPYYSPLSTSAWFLGFGALAVLLDTFSWVVGSFGTLRKGYFIKRREQCRKLFADGFERTTKECALQRPSEIDGRALMWLLQRSDDDQKLEQFFAGIRSLGHSQLVDVSRAFLVPLREKATEALFDFVHHTLTSNLVSPSIKQQRLDICKKAMDTAPFRVSRQTFRRFVNADWRSLLTSIEFGRMLGRAERDDPLTAYYSRIMLSIILPEVQERDERWFQLASDHLTVERPELETYLARGDSIRLANCTHVLRNILSVHFDYWRGDTLPKVLATFSSLDIRGTLPELQHEFCHEWNRMVDMGHAFSDTRDGSQYTAVLKNIRLIYIALHQGTHSAPTAFDAATTDEHILSSLSSYPKCNISRNTPHPASLSRDPVTGATAQTFPYLQQRIAPPIVSAINTPLPPQQWE